MNFKMTPHNARVGLLDFYPGDQHQPHRVQLLAQEDNTVSFKNYFRQLPFQLCKGQHSVSHSSVTPHKEGCCIAAFG